MFMHSEDKAQKSVACPVKGSTSEDMTGTRPSRQTKSYQRGAGLETLT